MNQAVIYARFSPRPMNCPVCQNRMNKIVGLDAYGCPSCDHVDEVGDGERGSIQAQLERCREHCRTQDYEVAGEYDDEFISGATVERPGLDAAINALKRGGVLVVHMLDRLSRGDCEQWADIEKRIRDKKARYESASGQGTLNPSEENDMIRDLVRVFDNYARRMGNRRTSEMMKAHQKAGRRMTPKGKIPFGLMVDPGDPARMVESPVEQETIRLVMDVYREVLSKGSYHGKGYREAARLLKQRNVKARNGGALAHGLVTDIIKKHTCA